MSSRLTLVYLILLAGASLFAAMRMGSGISADAQATAAAGSEQQQRQGHMRTPSSDSSAAQAAPNSPASQQRLPQPSYRAAGGSTLSAAGRPDSSPVLTGHVGQQPPWFQAPHGNLTRSSVAQKASAFERVLHEATAGLRTTQSLASARCGVITPRLPSAA